MHGANEFCFCAIKVPIEDAFCFSQIHVSLGFLIVDLEGAHSGVADPAIRFPWRYIGVGQPQPRLGHSGPGPGKSRIELDRALKEFKTFAQFRFAAFVGIEQSVKISIIRFRVPGRRGRNRQLEL